MAKVKEKEKPVDLVKKREVTKGLTGVSLEVLEHWNSKGIVEEKRLMMWFFYVDIAMIFFTITKIIVPVLGVPAKKESMN